MPNIKIDPLISKNEVTNIQYHNLLMIEDILVHSTDFPITPMGKHIHLRIQLLSLLVSLERANFELSFSKFKGQDQFPVTGISWFEVQEVQDIWE